MNDLMNSAVCIENTAQEFWALVGGAPTYPCDIQTAITLALPLEVYSVPGLRVSDVLAWMRRVTITHHIRGRNRCLHGCLLADRGKGTIFFDRQDPESEQRFTLAHELAHFLLDYQAPRQRAVGVLGPSILPVLDGECPPSRIGLCPSVRSRAPLWVGCREDTAERTLVTTSATAPR